MEAVRAATLRPAEGGFEGEERQGPPGQQLALAPAVQVTYVAVRLQAVPPHARWMGLLLDMAVAAEAEGYNLHRPHPFRSAITHL